MQVITSSSSFTSYALTDLHRPRLVFIRMKVVYFDGVRFMRHLQIIFSVTCCCHSVVQA
jgi:hypothetical protein